MTDTDLKQIGKYKILASLGRGSMGVVYKAQDSELGRIVAIKTLRTVLLSEPGTESEALRRFKQESRSAGKLQHPNIVTVYEAGRAENGYPYIVMEFIEGESLERIIGARAPLDPLEVLHYAAQLASAIDYAHRQNVIHRDIKPGNVLIDQSFVPHLLDFGVAKLSDNSLTPAGTVVGTPSYMSPEQIRGEELDGGTDIFALSVMTFEMLTAKRPFPGSDFTAVVSNIIHREPLSGREVGIELPEGTEAVLRRALAKDRTSRFPSALEFVDAVSRSFSVTIDGTGLVGGYRPGMTLSEVNLGSRRGRIVRVQGSSPQKEPQEVKGSSLPSWPDTDKEASETGSVEAARTVREKAATDPSYVRHTMAPPESVGWKLMRGLAMLTVVLVIAGGAGLFFFPTVVDDLRAVARNTVQRERSGLGEVELGTGSVETVAGDAHDAAAKTVEPSQVGGGDSATSVVPVGRQRNESPEMQGVDVLKPVRPRLPVEEISRLGVHGLSDEELAFLLADEGSPDELVRSAVREAFARKREVLLPFLNKLIDHPQYLVRVELLKNLSSAKGFAEAEVFPISRVLLSDQEFLVRGYAAKLLITLGTEEALLALEEREKVEKNDVVLRVVRSGIEQLRQGKGVGGIPRQRSE